MKRHKTFENRRLTWLAAVTLAGLMFTGCLVGELPEGGGEQPATNEAKTKFKTDAYPALQAGSCGGCHGAGGSGPVFMTGANADAVYDSLVASTVVDFAAPASSKLITKGVHTGRAFTTTESAAILTWLEVEKAARP